MARGKGLVETFLPGPRASVPRTIKERWPDAVESVDLLLRFQRQVIEYFTGKRTRFTLRVDLSGVPAFRQAVLEACRRIPYGQTASYADLARAAGSTMANNPLPLVIPCHRVLRADGSIGGFSTPQGVKQKKRLLRLENALSYVSPV